MDRRPSSGAINIRTVYPKSIPETKVNSFSAFTVHLPGAIQNHGMVLILYQYGISVSHLQQFDNIDVSIGASYYSDGGYIGGGA